MVVRIRHFAVVIGLACLVAVSVACTPGGGGGGATPAAGGSAPPNAQPPPGYDY